MKKKDIYRIIDEISPLKYAEGWDNCGVQTDVGPEDAERILCALEINDAVIDEAIEKDIDLIVTHHPLIFEGLKSLDEAAIPSRYVIRLIKAGISVFSVHTCFDVADGGINDCLAEKLGLLNVRKVCPLIPGEEKSMLLRIGELEENMDLKSFAGYVSKKLEIPAGVRVAGDPERIVRSVCVCGGSGSEYWKEAMDAGADVFVSGEVKHHDAAPAVDSGFAVICATHAGTEKWFAENMAAQLKERIGDGAEVIISESESDPFK